MGVVSKFHQRLVVSLSLGLCCLAGTALAQDEMPVRVHREPDWNARANLPTNQESIALIALINGYQADQRAISSFYTMHFDPASLDRLDRLYRTTQSRLDSIDFDTLDAQGKIDWLLFTTHLEAQINSLTLSRSRLDEMQPLIPFAPVIIELEKNRIAARKLDYAKAAAALDELADEIETLQKQVVKAETEQARDSQTETAPNPTHSENAESQPESQPDAKPEPAAEIPAKAHAQEEDAPIEISAVLANRTGASVRQLRRTLDHWYSSYDQYEPGFAWWMEKPHERASQALNTYADHLSKTIAGVQGKPEDPLIGDPVGREQLLTDLRAEWIPYTPEELIEIAEKQFAWCEGEMVKASREMGMGDDWHKALEAVKNDYVEPGEQDDLVAEIAQRSITYLDENNLVTVPPLARELWRIEMISPETQRVLPFAFYGGNFVGVAYAAQSMDNEDKLMSMRGNNRHFAMSVVPHELIPGHHLQGFIAQRERPYRSMFRTPFLVEGWALYWEMFLYDHNWVSTPQDRIGMLFWRMHRCARIIVSLKFHLGEMSPEEMIDFLVDRVGHERSGATSEVRRFIGGAYSPLYQCAYMLGGLQLRSLHHDLVDNGTMREREFHDTVLSYNAIPIELIRAGMTGQPLTRQTHATWRFSDE